MTTQYSQTLTLAVPDNLIEAANHLACLMGEAAARPRACMICAGKSVPPA